MKSFTRNYNGGPIKTNEVMVPFEYTELDAKAVTNPECISSITVGKKRFRVIYKAVDQAWEKDARAAFNLYQNEEFGYYAVPNSVSRDAMEDEYELDLVSVPSAEDIIMAVESAKETINTFDITKHKQYPLLSDYDKKNEFDIEKYVKNRNRLRFKKNDVVDEVCDVGEITA